MSGKELFESMSHIDEGFIEEAETKSFPRMHWARPAALAACLCLILLGLYTLRSPAATEGESAQDELTESADGAAMGGMIIPENKPAQEVPSVLLYVQSQTESGFTGIVTELVDTDIFEIGMELNVVLTETIRQEDADGNSIVVDQKRPDYTGCCVLVQFIEYDRESGTIVVNLIREVQLPETTP